MVSSGTILVVGIVAVVFFGGKRLRHLGEDLGAALRSFRRGLQDEETGKEQKVRADSKAPLE